MSRFCLIFKYAMQQQQRKWWITIGRLKKLPGMWLSWLDDWLSVKPVAMVYLSPSPEIILFLLSSAVYLTELAVQRVDMLPFTW